MKTSRLALCLFTLLLSLLLLFATSVFSVSAQEPEPPTLTPGPFFFSTPTPVSVVSGIHPCPDGIPSGFGSVTPSKRWLYECAHCLPFAYSTVTPIPSSRFLPTPVPTFDIFSTPTPYYSFTPTVTPTPAVTPTPDQALALSGFYMYSVSSPEVYISPDTWVDAFLLKVKRSSSYNPHTYSYYVEVRQSDLSVCGFLRVYQASLSIQYDAFFTYDYEAEFCTSGRDGQGCGSQSGYGLASISTIPFCTNYSSDSCLSCNLDWLRLKVTVHTDNDYDASRGIWFVTDGLMPYNMSTQFVTEKRYSLSPFVIPTPTPTSTPVISDTYCFSVQEDTEPDLQLPVFTIGNSFCYGLDALNITIPVLGEFSFPGIHVCFDEISFGNINLFGLSISLDLLSSVIAAVVTLRILLRS